MKEYFSLKNSIQNEESGSELNQTIKNLLTVQIKRMKVKESNDFLKNIDKYFDYLTTDFKKRLSIYFNNNLDQDSSLGKQLSNELKEIIKDKMNNVELADYEIIDNE
jgi:hypothetical protein